MTGDDRLREAWLLRADLGVGAPECGEAQRLWAVALGDAAPDEARRAVLHAARCAACAAALRLAREIAAEAGLMAVARRRTAAWPSLAAAAAIVAIGAALAPWLARIDRSPAPAYRGENPPAISPLVPDDAVLPRERFVLRWTPGPAGTRYSVRVARGDLTPISSAHALETAEWQVPAVSLDGIAPGTALYWRVEAHFPDGGTSVSQAFRVRLP